MREVSTEEDHTGSFKEKKATDDHSTEDECEEKGEHTRDMLDDFEPDNLSSEESLIEVSQVCSTDEVGDCSNQQTEECLQQFKAW